MAPIRWLPRALFEAPAVQLVALTLGAEGALLLSRQASVRQAPPEDVKVVDTVGAGDCFFAGLLAGVQRAGKLRRDQVGSLEEGTLERLLAGAIATATLNVMQAGCCPPALAQVEEFLAAPLSLT